MIQVTTLAGKSIYVNDLLIRQIDSTPDTVLYFTDGTRLPVKESAKEIVEKIKNIRTNKDAVWT
jgi:uncharacterized protein YlzI (FlbEa/FlbD family)